MIQQILLPGDNITQLNPFVISLLKTNFDLYYSFGYFSRQQIDNICFILPENRFDISCKLSPMAGDNLHEISNLAFSNEDNLHAMSNPVFSFGDNLHEMPNPVCWEK